MSKAIARDPIYRRRRFQPEIIELCVRWYLTYRLSYRERQEPGRSIAVSAACGLSKLTDRKPSKEG